MMNTQVGRLLRLPCMRKPGVSSTRTPFTAPTRGGIGGLGEAVFKVSQSRCLWPPPQKRHGPIFAVYGRSFPHLLFLTRGAVSVFVVMAATLAASLEITSRRSSVGDYSPEEVRAAFRTDFLRPSGGGEVSRSSSRAKMYSRTWSMNQKDRLSLYSFCMDIVSLKDVQFFPLIADVMKAHSSRVSSFLSRAASRTAMLTYKSVIC